MTGPEHYAKAEQLLEDAHKMQHDSGPGCGSEELIAEAQVHATLALAAATALRDPETGLSTPDWDAWCKAAGTTAETVAAP